MKNSVNLNSSEWCDIIFEGKNKSYGAFELRQSASKRYIWAFGIVLVAVAFVACLPMIISSVKAANIYTGGMDETRTVILVDPKMPEPIADVAKPEIPEPPKFVEMKKFVPPTIANDEEVEEVMTGMEDLVKDKSVVIGAFEVENGSKDADAIRKEFAADVVGDGTGTGKAEPEKVFVSAQFMPQFPGGEAEMYRFISENLKYPVVDQEMGTQGRVTVRFVVTKTGEISDIQLLKGISISCDKEAMRVIKSMPRWIPGKNNGEPVQVYFTLPIVFKLKQ
ncbi:protein TonB [Dysgonomonas sp. PFB1-18]|uniref:energy transducer TonB n=1 Tax=unclassified Dysgonomonas TaxID=2630389 RepID=UPI0024750F3C|nr:MULTISPECIES: energy transducer TonB [unclassified Dysgonomonas]MDH6309129.1 protein TonB [Dysgonomonas sp. PF1-14]MDH6338991.1 protein TonB [Dysgonomonas sp. PF1-16]MDH6380378.1 protein TonB [Dysgonomonas sp. PFB1-18]MDH6397819.1 protein TonB [Dysgonomonas sp. PF1-23]